MRFVPVVVGLVVLVGGGVVHGLWSDRWTHATVVEEWAARLEQLPADLGSWKGVPHEQDPAALDLAGAVGHYSRTFTDPATGEQVLVILLCGKPSRLVVHRPEHCYRAAGYEMLGPQSKEQVSAPGVPPADFFTGLFSRDEAAGPSQMRIHWSWFDGDRWQAPESPRLAFVHRPALLKLYVIRNVTGATAPPTEDPAVRLLGLLLPELQRKMIDE